MPEIIRTATEIHRLARSLHQEVTAANGSIAMCRSECAAARMRLSAAERRLAQTEAWVEAEEVRRNHLELSTLALSENRYDDAADELAKARAVVIPDITERPA